MSTTVNALSGDTFSSIARRVFGDDTKASLIAGANPGVTEPLMLGTLVLIPADPSAPTDSVSGITAQDADEIAINVDGARFRFWESVTIDRRLDAMDTFSFSAPAGPAVSAGFKPLQFPAASIFIGSEALLTGTVITVDPVLSQSAKTLAVGGYSTPGVLGDCMPPASSFPLEFRNLTLESIAKKIAAPFGITVVFNSPAGAKFDLVACDPETTALQFLIELAKKRGLIVASTPHGALKFFTPDAGIMPVARFKQGTPPFGGIDVKIDPQSFYSSVTGVRKATIARSGGKYTMQNPLLKGITRPFTFNIDDTDTGSVKAAVQSKYSRMYAAVVAYSMTLPTWRTPTGTVWAPGDTVTVYAPDAMIVTEYKLMVRGVKLTASKKSRECTLDLVLPEVFSESAPLRLPWDL